MRSAGFTLIELLIVFSLTSILGVVGFVNFKDYASDQVTARAVGQIQTVLRLAQSNANSYTNCDGQQTSSWFVYFPTSTEVIVNCHRGGTEIGTAKSYPLQDARVVITGDSACALPVPVKISYLPGVATQVLDATGEASSCAQSSTITFTVSNTRNPSSSAKTLRISKGGAINVQ